MVFMMVGIQGSGKTTFAKKLAKEKKVKIVSTDMVRKNLPGIKEELVWPYVYKQVASLIREGKDVIFDATSITPKVRKRFVDQVESHDVKVEIGIYFFETDKDVCHARVVERNKNKDALVIPPEVVYSFSEKLIPPTLDEGFKFIRIVKNGEVVDEITNA